MLSSTPGRLRGSGQMRVYICLRDEGKALCVDEEDKTSVREMDATNSRGKTFSCEEAFSPEVPVGDIFHTCVRPLLLYALDGATSTFFVYGQTGIGKSSLMHSHSDASKSGIDAASQHGIIGRSIDQLYELVVKRPDSYVIKASYLEILAGDDIVDLLDPTPPTETQYRISANSENFYNDRCVNIENLTQPTVASKQELWGVYEKGKANRRMMKRVEGDNEYQSSQSHTIFQICIQYSAEESGEEGGVLLGSAGTITTGYLNLVDLMGGCENSTAVSSGPPNTGLDALHSVINKLAGTSSSTPSRRSSDASPTKKHIPFRDSNLTRILKPSFQGHSMIVTSILCMASTLKNNREDSLQVLKFSQVCKTLKLYQIDTFDYEDMVEKMMKEIQKLRRELDARANFTGIHMSGDDGGNMDSEQVKELINENHDLKKHLKEARSQALSIREFRDMELDLAQQRREVAMERENLNEDKHNFIEEKKNLRSDMDILKQKEEKMGLISHHIDIKESELLVRVDNIMKQKALWDDSVKDLIQREEKLEQSQRSLREREKLLSDVKADISRKQKMMVDREQELSQKETSMKIKFEDIEKAENDIKLKEQAIQNRVAEVERKEKQMSQSHNQLNEREEAFKHSERLMEKERAELVNSKQLLAKNEESLHQLERNLVEREESIQKSLKEIKARNIDMESNFTKANNLASKSNMTIEKYNAEIVKVKEIKKELMMQIESCHRWEEELNDKDADLVLLENSLRSAEADLNNLEKEREIFKEERRIAKSEEDKIKADISTIALRHSKQVEDFELFIMEMLETVKSMYEDLEEQRQKAMADSDNVRKDHTIAVSLFKRDTSEVVIGTSSEKGDVDLSKINTDLYLLSCKVRDAMEKNIAFGAPSSSTTPSRSKSILSYSQHYMNDHSLMSTRNNSTYSEPHFGSSDVDKAAVPTIRRRSTVHHLQEKSIASPTTISPQQDPINSLRRTSMLSHFSSSASSARVVGDTYNHQEIDNDSSSVLSKMFPVSEGDEYDKNDGMECMKEDFDTSEIDGIQQRDIHYNENKDQGGEEMQPMSEILPDSQTDDALEDVDHREASRPPLGISTLRRSRTGKQTRVGSLFSSDGGYSAPQRNIMLDGTGKDESAVDKNTTTLAQSFRHILEKRPISERSRVSSMTSVQSGVSDETDSDHMYSKLPSNGASGTARTKRRVSFSERSVD